MTKLIIAVPAYNEEMALSSVLKKIAQCQPKDTENRILVINDGSTDNTKEIAISNGADFIVSHKHNLGVAQAYRTAIVAALELGADIICTIDADGQFCPSEIPKLVAPIKSGMTDVVIGSRFMNPALCKNIPIMNKIANQMMAKLISLLIRKQVYDTECGFRAISSTAAANLDLLGLVSFSNDMILDTSMKNFRILEVPVSVKYYEERDSRVIKGFIKYGIKSFCLIILKILSASLSRNLFSKIHPQIEVIRVHKGEVTPLNESGVINRGKFIQLRKAEGVQTT